MLKFSSRLLILLAAFFLLMAALGCGAPAEDAAEEEDPAAQEEPAAEEEAPDEEPAEEPEEPEETALNIDDWRNPTGISEIVDNFEEMEWTWAHLEDGEEVNATTVTYRWEGSETVDGIDAEQLYFSVNEDEFTIWVDDDGNPLQADFQGEMIPGEFVDQAMDAALSTIFAPFWTFEELGAREALIHEAAGFEYSVTSTGEEQVGDVTAEVTRMDVEVGPPAAPEGYEGTATWAVGDFGEFQMLIEWDWAEATGEEDLNVIYSLDRVVPR